MCIPRPPGAAPHFALTAKIAARTDEESVDGHDRRLRDRDPVRRTHIRVGSAILAVVGKLSRPTSVASLGERGKF